MDIPAIRLSDGNYIPQLGLGTYKTESGDEVKNAVLAAVKNDYRLIDTASLYGNEKGIGEALRASKVPRDELFITSKLWNADQGYEKTLKAFDASLKELQLDYLDMYLIHWPIPSDNRYIETWKAFIDLKKQGKIRSIGVSNFEPSHLEALIKNTGVAPVVNQVELHPRLQQKQLREYCAAHAIQVESWRPIGGSSDLLLDQTLLIIADKHKRTVAQIVLRWHIQLGLVVIPKSVHEKRIIENANIFEFELDNDDMAKISALDNDTRYGPHPLTMNAKTNASLVRFVGKFKSLP